MSFTFVAAALFPKFSDLLQFSLSHYVPEYANYLVSPPFGDPNESGVTLKIRDRHDIAEVTSVGAWVNQWTHCRGHGMYVSLFASSEAALAFVSCYEEVEYKRVLWDLIRSNCGREVPKVTLSLDVLCGLFYLFYLIGFLGYY